VTDQASAPHFHLAPAGLREQIVATLEALPVAYWTPGSIASRIMPVIGAAFDQYRDTLGTPDNPAASADAPDPGTLAAIARIHADAIRSLHEQTAGRLDDHDARLLRGLDDELAKVLEQLGEQAEPAAVDKPAGDDGPSIAECAADDRRWFDGEKAGE